MIFFKHTNERYISQVVVLSMIFGLAGGIVGQLVTDVYINPVPQQYLLNPDNDIINTIPELRRVKKFLGIEQDFEVNSAVSKITPTIVGIYNAKPASGILAQIYLPSDLLATGFTLTSDGWIVSYSNSIDESNFDNFVIVYNGEIFAINQVATDLITPVVFLKVSANNWPVAVLGDSDELNLGQLTLALNALGEVTVKNVTNTAHIDINSGSDYIWSSEEYTKSIVLEGALPDNYLGSPLVNLGGEVVGVVSQIGSPNKVLPINQFSSIVLDVLRSNVVKRSYLGVDYLDLSKVKGISNTLAQDQTRGALVYASPQRNSPAAVAGIVKNDILLSINGQPINEATNLTDLVQQYKPGDKVSFEILRQGQNVNIELTLALSPE